MNMANAEHLKMLSSGVKEWNEWRKDNINIKPDLSYANLSEANLSHADLSYVDLFHAHLFDTNLSHADMYKADLYKADLENANLSNANLSEAELNPANLYNAKLSHANLSRANLFNANLYNANLFHANLSHAHLSDTNLSKTRMHETNFNECYLGGVIFGLTDLSTCLGLSSTNVVRPCIIDFQTLRASKNIPKSFLLKIGLPELYIDYLPEFYMDALTLYPAFLSHSWKNKPFARKLYEALIAKGVNVFFDEKKLKPGDDFYESLSKGIEHYDKMILVCSKESLTESWWVDREIDRLLAKERELMKERGHRVNLLIPIMIDDYIFEWQGAKKEEIKRYLIGDFREWENEEKFEGALTNLIHALNVDRPDIKPKSFL